MNDEFLNKVQSWQDADPYMRKCFKTAMQQMQYDEGETVKAWEWFRVGRILHFSDEPEPEPISYEDMILSCPWFWPAAIFLGWAFGWEAALGWYFILLYEKHKHDELKG